MVSPEDTESMAEPVALHIHQPCDDCGSSDALTINVDNSTKCFSCGKFTPGDNAQAEPTPPTHKQYFNMVTGKFKNIDNRKITEETCRTYDYQIGLVDDKACHIANYYDTKGNKIAQKYRFKDKKFKCNNSPNYFFGQHLWANPENNRKLVVTEGELDCMSCYQILGNKNNYPVVSLPQGSTAAKSMFKKHYEWLAGFAEVILMFDEDEAGQKAVEEVAHLLPAGKCKVAKLPLKDASDCLMAGKSKAVVNAIYSAKLWRPDDIIEGTELLDRLKNPKTYESTPYPFEGLNKLTHGIRKGEIVTMCAGSGQGKSQVCRVIAHHLLTTTDLSVGYIALEESVERTALSLVGLDAGKCLHLEPFEADEKFDESFNRTVGNGRFFLYDHFGSIASDSLLNRIRFMIKTYEVDFICLDHLSIVVSGTSYSEGGDERRLIDNTMTKLRSLVEETKVAMLLVSHLKRPEGRGHEEGATTSLAQLRGSASIAQLSDICVGLERSQQAEDEEDRNKTAVRVLKNRFSGETGIACELFYDKTTGRLSETLQETIDMPF